MKKIFITLFAVLFALQSFALTRCLVAGGTGNWNSTTNWSAASGGSSGASFPIAGDDVIIDAGSANTSINVNVAAACSSIFISGYTGNFTMTNTLAVTGNVTLGSGMVPLGSGTLAVNATGTITSNGVTIPWTLNFSGVSASVITVADNWDVNGTLIFSSSAAGNAVTINGNTINAGGGLTIQTNGNRSVVGTTNIILDGTGNWSGGSNAGLNLNLTINTAGTITIPATVNYGTNTLSYVAGTVNATTGTLQTRSSCTLNLAGVTLNNFTTAAATQTLTLSSNLLVSGTMSLASNTTFAGTGVWTATNFDFSSSIATARIVQLKAGSTYTVTGSMTTTQGTFSAMSMLKSDTPGTKAILTLGPAVTQKNIYLDITDIDSSGGITGWTVSGLVLTSLNWNVLPTQPQTITTSN